MRFQCFDLSSSKRERGIICPLFMLEATVSFPGHRRELRIQVTSMHRPVSRRRFGLAGFTQGHVAVLTVCAKLQIGVWSCPIAR
jgi:hypothetical protein